MLLLFSGNSAHQSVNADPIHVKACLLTFAAYISRGQLRRDVITSRPSDHLRFLESFGIMALCALLGVVSQK